MGLVCLDTNILIWAIKEESTPGQEDLITKSTAFLQHLEDKEKKILLPTVVLTEFLFRLPVESHKTVMNLLSQNYFVAPFDELSALMYAKIWNDQEHKEIEKDLKDSGVSTRTITADRMIVATAVAHEAECIYSHDTGLRKCATGFCDAYDIPTIPQQGNLFD